MSPRKYLGVSSNSSMLRTCKKKGWTFSQNHFLLLQRFLAKTKAFQKKTEEDP